MSDDLYSPSWYRVWDVQPRLRGHVRIHRHHYRGETWYVLEDRVSRRMHRFNPVAHYVIGLMDGRRSVQDLWDQATARFGDDAPTQGEMIQLLGQLHQADVLQSEVTPDLAELLRRAHLTRHRAWKQKYLSLLAFRIPLFDPDRLLGHWLPRYRPLFGWAGALVWCLVVGAALLSLGVHWAELTQDLSDRVLAPSNLFILLLTFPAIKLLHEFGHACATKAWGGEVHEMGIMLLVLMPIPYVDATSASAFPETRRRVVVGAAGMIVEVFVAALALFLWVEVQPGVVRAVLYDIMLIAGASTVLFNGNPLLRFDGYYILCDLLQIPNLRTRGQRYLAYLVESRIFRVRLPEFDAAPGERRWLALYAVAAFVYRIFVALVIALFIATQYFIIGVLLALSVVIWSIGYPLSRGIAYLAAHPKLQRRRGRAVGVTAAVAGCLAIMLFLVPLPLWTNAEGITWAPEGAVVSAGTEGFVRTIAAAPGNIVRRGSTLILTEDPGLPLRLRVLEAQLRLLEARALAELQIDRVRWALTQEEIVSVQAELALAQQRAAELAIRSPADGVLLLPSAEDLTDRFLRKGQQVGFVVRPETITVRVLVPQEDADLVLARTKRVEAKLAGRSYETLEAVVRRAVPAASNQLPNAALAIIGGGLIPIDPREANAPTALRGWFELELELPSTRIHAVGERVYVRFEHGPEPLAWRIYRSLRQLFMKRFIV